MNYITFPGNLAAAMTLADLRALDSEFLAPETSILLQGSASFGDGDGGMYVWDGSSLAVDNATTVIKPDDRTPLEAGRWLAAGGTGGGTTYLAGPGIFIDSGAISTVDAKDFRTIWVNDYYPNGSSTDSDALDAVMSVLVATFVDCRLKFAAGKGRGPSGRYLIDREIVIPGGGKVWLDFDAATIRYTTPASKFRYVGVQTTSTQPATDYFVMDGGVHQMAAAVDCLGLWDMPFNPSRMLGTGFARNMRVVPQTVTNAGHTIKSVFRTKNAWYFSVMDCHVTGHPDVAASLTTDSCLIEQQGLCVEARIDGTETNYLDKVFIPGFSTMVGINGTVNTGTYARGKRLQQGSVVGYFGRNDGAYGFTYSLYDTTGGTFVNGAANILDSVGAVVGTFTISGVGSYTQASEALHVINGSTFVQCNAFSQFTSPDTTNARALDWTFSDMHCAFHENFIQGDGISVLEIGTGCFLFPYVAGTTMIDINHAGLVSINGIKSTTNGLAGNTGIKLRNTESFNIIGNGLDLFATPTDIDNTCKDGTVAFNRGIVPTSGPVTGLMVNTANRYNATSTRGMIYRSNGQMGVGIDTDDPRKQVWTPVPTSSAGTITSYTVANAQFNLNNGVLTLSCKLTITNRGTASGSLYLSGPTLPTGVGYDFKVNSTTSDQANLSIYDTGNNRIVMTNASVLNSSGDAFSVANVPGNYIYYFQTSVPVQYN